MDLYEPVKFKIEVVSCTYNLQLTNSILNFEIAPIRHLNNEEEEVSNCVEVTQETPTKRRRPQTNKTPINPYSTSSKEEVKDKKFYHGWRQVIEATIQGTTLHQMETQKNVQNLATKQTKPKINKKKKRNHPK